MSDNFEAIPLQPNPRPKNFADRCLITSFRDKHDKVSSFVYLVNDSQSAEEVETHQLHLQSWSKIFGTPPEREASKLLVASSLLAVLPSNIRDLCSTWKKNISGTEVTDLMPHREAKELVRHAVSSSSQMIVQLREELLRPLPLRKTTVGRHYVKILKKRRIELLQPRGHWWQMLLRRRQDPHGDLARLNRELGHWKKCKLPRECTDCLFVRRQNR